jgi:protease I
MAPKAKRIAILVEDMYQVLEVWYPLLRLKEDGIETQTIGTGTKETYGSKEGYPVKAELSIDRAKSSDFDGVIIPGGFAPDFMRRNPKMAEFIREVHDQEKVVAAICHGGWMLVSAKILKGRKATSFFAIRDDMEAAGAKWVDEEVVVDKNLITSRKPEDLTAFTAAVIAFLKNKQ